MQRPIRNVIIKKTVWRVPYCSEKEWKEKFAKKLSDMIQERCTSVNQFAKDCSISRSLLSLYLHAQRLPNAIYIQIMAEHLGCSVDDLLDV